MFYEDYNDGYWNEDDMKTDFHIKLDDIIDAEVEKRLEERIEDINRLRERQSQYDDKIAEANQKVKEADQKRWEAERARSKAETERDDTIRQCKQSISDATQQRLDEFFGDWLKEKYVYHIVRESTWLSCPYCKSGKVDVVLPNGDKAITSCKVCNGEGHTKYDRYETESIGTEYPTFMKEDYGKSIAPYFIQYKWNTGLHKVAVRNVMTREEAEEKAKQLTEENKQKALQRLKDRKEKLDKESRPC